MPTEASQSSILAGQIVLIIDDGVEGMEAFGKLRPDVVVTDIIMPNREGVETLMSIKALDPDVKVLAISGGGRLGSTDLLTMAQGLGADAVMAKPFRSTDVVSAVARLLQPSDG